MQRGPFWTNVAKLSAVEQILSSVINMEESEWRSHLSVYEKIVMNMDPGNLTLQAKLSQALKR